MHVAWLSTRSATVLGLTPQMRHTGSRLSMVLRMEVGKLRLAPDHEVLTMGVCPFVEGVGIKAGGNCCGLPIPLLDVPPDDQHVQPSVHLVFPVELSQIVPHRAGLLLLVTACCDQVLNVAVRQGDTSTRCRKGPPTDDAHQRSTHPMSVGSSSLPGPRLRSVELPEPKPYACLPGWAEVSVSRAWFTRPLICFGGRS